MIGQIELEDYLRWIRIEEERKHPPKTCKGCKCGRDYGTMYNLHDNCEHWERGTCPVAKTRIETPYRDWHMDRRNDCAACGGVKHVDGSYNCVSGEWFGLQHYKTECQYYKKSTMHSVPCLNGHVIKKWEDGTMFCAICEANGCEDCYKEFEKMLEETE